MDCKWAREAHIGVPRQWWGHPIDLEDRPIHSKIQAMEPCEVQASVTPPVINSRGCLWNPFSVIQKCRDEEMEVKSLA